jgi:hypothetical protein
MALVTALGGIDVSAARNCRRIACDNLGDFEHFVRRRSLAHLLGNLRLDNLFIRFLELRDDRGLESFLVEPEHFINQAIDLLRRQMRPRRHGGPGHASQQYRSQVLAAGHEVLGANQAKLPAAEISWLGKQKSGCQSLTIPLVAMTSGTVLQIKFLAAEQNGFGLWRNLLVGLS